MSTTQCKCNPEMYRLNAYVGIWSHKCLRTSNADGTTHEDWCKERVSQDKHRLHALKWKMAIWELSLVLKLSFKRTHRTEYESINRVQDRSF